MAESQTIVITGASSGIGAALTRALAEDGHRLFVCARRADRLAEVTDQGRLASGIVCDVTQEADVARFVAAISETSPNVYALFNCAGAFGAIGPITEVDAAMWQRTVGVNLFGTFLMCKHVAPLMRPERRPRIVNFSGGGAFDPLPNYSAYAVSKAGIVRLTETLAVELAPKGIAVNAVAPGFVATEIHDATLAVGARAAGEDFFAMTKAKLKEGAVPMAVPVNLARFLISPRADGLTGKTISASFDPWSASEFAARIAELNTSPLYTMQRINLVHLAPDDPLRTALTAASSRAKP